MHTLILTTINMRTKFKYLVSSAKFENGSRVPDHAHLGLVCNSKANARYDVPLHKA